MHHPVIFNNKRTIATPPSNRWPLQVPLNGACAIYGITLLISKVENLRVFFFLKNLHSSFQICQPFTVHKYLLLLLSKLLACTCDINAVALRRRKLHLCNCCTRKKKWKERRLFQVVSFSFVNFQTFNQGAREIFLFLRGDIHSYSTVFLRLCSIQRQTPHHMEKQIFGWLNPRKALLCLQ